jgi:hypothetical protein
MAGGLPFPALAMAESVFIARPQASEQDIRAHAHRLQKLSAKLVSKLLTNSHTT